MSRCWLAVAYSPLCDQVYEDEHTLAFLGKLPGPSQARKDRSPPPSALDILPIRPGHLLVIPKQHYARV